MNLTPMHQARSLEAPVTLTDLADRVQTIARDCRDYPSIPLAETRVEQSGCWRYNGECGTLTRHALGQLCSRLELPGGGTVPAGYLARCPASLAAEHLNHWLTRPEREAKRVFVRVQARNDTPAVRAVLSDRYAPVDHLPLLQALSHLVPGHGLALQAWSLDDEQLTLRLTVNHDHPASLDDPLRVGVHITNSEIGLARISITALITRLVCSNGLVVRVADLGGVHRRHIGRAGENLQDLIHSALRCVLDQANEAVRRFTRLRGEPAPGPIERYVERVVRDADLPDVLSLQVLERLDGETLYDLLNAFTLAAQSFPVSERVRIEASMGRFLRDGVN